VLGVVSVAYVEEAIAKALLIVFGAIHPWG
jgi:hypothetical protein